MIAYGGDTVTTMLRGDDPAPAIGAPGRPPMTYGALRSLVERTVASLNRIGIGRNDRVAIVLPNGPEMAAAFIAVACCAIAAPLNPAYRTNEFEFYLRDLNPKCLLVQCQNESAARETATSLGIPIVELLPGTDAGDFLLCTKAEPAGHPVTAAAPKG